MPTRRSWSSTKTASINRTSARSSGKRFVSCGPPRYGEPFQFQFYETELFNVGNPATVLYPLAVFNLCREWISNFNIIIFSTDFPV